MYFLFFMNISIYLLATLQLSGAHQNETISLVSQENIFLRNNNILRKFFFWPYQLHWGYGFYSLNSLVEVLTVWNILAFKFFSRLFSFCSLKSQNKMPKKKSLSYFKVLVLTLENYKFNSWLKSNPVTQNLRFIK